MTISVRDGRDVERSALIELMSRNLPRYTDGRIFGWLYGETSYGQGRICIAVDAGSGVVAGVAAAFPRRFYVGDDEVSACVLGDFCLDAQYRSLGPALQLQRACLKMTEQTRGTFCYDFPSPSMVSVYRRLSVPITGRMVRLAKLIRVNRKVRDTVRSPIVERVLSSIGNTVLHTLPVGDVVDASVELSIHSGYCGEEFSIVDRRQRGRLGICAQRSAEYLNWRYVDNPIARHEIVTARRNGVLKGYAVWVQLGEDASVVDLFGENDPIVVKGLLGYIIRVLRNRNVVTLSACLNEGHPWFHWYTEMGFRVRDAAPIVCIPSPALAKTMDLQSAPWFLMQGDRDS